MKVLMLYGVNCREIVWQNLKPYLKNYEIDYVEYPHEITLNAKKVQDLSQWVYDHYPSSYDVVIGHSLGGIIALELVAIYKKKFNKIIYLDTNLKPANEFYRNLMMPDHMEKYGKPILNLFQKERNFYTPELFKAIQEDFDYTPYLDNINEKVYALYGDRGYPDYPNKISDLNLTTETLNKLDLRFIHNACHMIMIENPKALSDMIESIIKE